MSKNSSLIEITAGESYSAAAGWVPKITVDQELRRFAVRDFTDSTARLHAECEGLATLDWELTPAQGHWMLWELRLTSEQSDVPSGRYRYTVVVTLEGGETVIVRRGELAVFRRPPAS